MNSNVKDTGLNCRPASGKFPSFEKPQPVGYFSLNTKRQYEPTASQLQYYKPPFGRFPLDLNEGLSFAVKKPESAFNEGIDHLLKFIYDNQERLFTSATENTKRPLVGAEFVCYRGLLRQLMCIPYENRENVCIHVTRYMGTFYLCKPDTEQDKFKRANETQQMQKMTSWGFKFEQYCLSNSPSREPMISAPVDECAEFSCVFKTRLGGLEILYAAEMDGVVSEQPVQLGSSKLDGLKFIELKTRLGDLNQRQTTSYHRFKTRNWWCQSFLVGIEDIYVGLRTENGLVQKIEHVEVRSLPKLGATYWDPSVCAQFAIQFLMYLRTVMDKMSCPHTVYAFYYDAQKLRITYECFHGKSTHSFLPDWYVALLQRKAHQ